MNPSDPTLTPRPSPTPARRGIGRTTAIGARTLTAGTATSPTTNPATATEAMEPPPRAPAGARPATPAADTPATAADERPLYQQLADRLAQLMDSGALAAGTRLPSVREAAAEQLVSVSTVLQAYRLLEDQARIEVRPRSGYFVRRTPDRQPARDGAVNADGSPPAPGGARRSGRRTALAEPAPSHPPVDAQDVGISALTEQVMRAAADPAVISFGAACPEPELFDQERLRRALSQATLRHRGSLQLYPPPLGHEGLRQAIARRSLSMGCTLRPQDIVLTSSCTASVALCLQTVTRPGDTVALESPTCFSFLQMLEALHLKALEIPTHPRHGLSVDALALALRTQPVRAVLAVPTLQNPLGASMPLVERQRLAELLAEHQVPLIEDVIFNALAEREEHRRTVKSFDREGLVMLCGGFSKTLAPGLRVGWLEAGRHTEALRRRQAAMIGGHTGVVEAAMADLLEQPGMQAQLRRLRNTHAPRIAEGRTLIAELFPAGTRVTDPAGGIMLWVELPPRFDTLALFHAALAEGICIAPGAMFSASTRYRHCLRLSVSAPWTPARRAALARLGELIAAQQDN
ncbi:MAG: hypothetical protein RLY78_808 [Pseudomonadota bacterium]